MKWRRMKVSRQVEPASKKTRFKGFTEPAVIPLQALGVIDVGATDIGNNEMLANALSNTSSACLDKGYAVKRGSEFVNEYGRTDDSSQRTDGGLDNPNHMMGSFVTLWPYAMGGIETRRPIDVPYNVHVQALIQRGGNAFRLHHHFIFQAFSVLQRGRCAALHVFKSKRVLSS